MDQRLRSAEPNPASAPVTLVNLVSYGFATIGESAAAGEPFFSVGGVPISASLLMEKMYTTAGALVQVREANGVLDLVHRIARLMPPSPPLLIPAEPWNHDDVPGAACALVETHCKFEWANGDMRRRMAAQAQARIGVMLPGGGYAAVGAQAGMRIAIQICAQTFQFEVEQYLIAGTDDPGCTDLQPVLTSLAALCDIGGWVKVGPPPAPHRHILMSDQTEHMRHMTQHTTPGHPAFIDLYTCPVCLMANTAFLGVSTKTVVPPEHAPPTTPIAITHGARVQTPAAFGGIPPGAGHPVGQTAGVAIRLMRHLSDNVPRVFLALVPALAVPEAGRFFIPMGRLVSLPVSARRDPPVPARKHWENAARAYARLVPPAQARPMAGRSLRPPVYSMLCMMMSTGLAAVSETGPRAAEFCDVELAVARVP